MRGNRDWRGCGDDRGCGLSAAWIQRRERETIDVWEFERCPPISDGWPTTMTMSTYLRLVASVYHQPALLCVGVVASLFSGRVLAHRALTGRQLPAADLTIIPTVSRCAKVQSRIVDPNGVPEVLKSRQWIRDVSEVPAKGSTRSSQTGSR